MVVTLLIIIFFSNIITKIMSLLRLKLDVYIQGQSSIIMNPYMNDYSKPKNLQDIDENFMSLKVNWYLKSNISIYNKMQIIYDKNEVSNVKFQIGLNLFIQKLS